MQNLRIWTTVMLILLFISSLFPGFAGNHYITVDGDPSDWIGSAPASENSGTYDQGEYIWRDAENDDTGDGDYVYPLNAAYDTFPEDDQVYDLLEWRVTSDENNVYFLFRIANITDPWSGPNGFSHQLPIILIDQDRVPGSGRTDIIRDANCNVSKDAAWEWAIWASGWTIGAEDAAGNTYQDSSFLGAVVAGDTSTDSIEIGIPISFIGDPSGETWRFVVILPGSRYDYCQRVDAVASDWFIGGGEGDAETMGNDPNFMDLAFYNSTSEQEAELGEYLTTGSTVVLDGYKDITFGQAFGGHVSVAGIDALMNGSSDRIATFNVTVSINSTEPQSYGLNLAVSGVSPGSGFLSDFNCTFSENDFTLAPGQSRTVILTLEYLGKSSNRTLRSGTHRVNVIANFTAGETSKTRGGWSTFDVDSPVPPIGGGFQTPDWVKHAIFYQIFPDRFRDGDPNNNAIGDGTSGDIVYKAWYYQPYTQYAISKSWGELPTAPPWGADFFGGDLQGVQEKIPYLVDLGITAVEFTPIMDSSVNHAYHVIDHKAVNRYFGAHQRGPNDELILDYNASLQVFKDLIAALDEYDIKVVTDGVFETVSAKNKFFDRDNDFPTDGAFESQSSPWYDWFTFYNWPNDYDCWYGVKDIPTPKEIDGYKDYIYRAPDSVLKFWNDLGVDGWRLDCGLARSHDFWREFRTYYKQLNPEGYIVGEEWGDASPWLQGDQWDSTMNYRWRGAVLGWANGGSVSTFNDALVSIQYDYPEGAFYTAFNMLGLHNTPRALRVLGENKTKMKLAVIFQMTYPGAPAIYYGDEVGMTGGNDPDSMRPYPWSDLGFSPDLDMFDHHKKLIEIRKSYPVLRTGALETKLVDDAKKIYVLTRRLDSSVAILVYNSGDASQAVTVDLSDLMADGALLTDVLNNETYSVSGGSVTMQTRGMWANILLSGVHDVAVTGIAPSNTVVGAGHTVEINVVTENQGNFTETFNVTLYHDGNAIGTQTVFNLAPRASATLTFNWNTTNISPGNYTIKAEASVVLGETYTLNNIYINGIVKVIQAQFTFTNLYTVNLFVNGTFVDGNNLTVRFYSYSGTYQAESTVWSGITPTQIELSENVSHPLGLPVEIVTLVLKYENGTTISTIITFTMCRPRLMERLVKLDEDWIFTPVERSELFLEIVRIDVQWPYAPGWCLHKE